MKAKEIAKLFKIIPQRVKYWIHREIIFPEKIRTKFIIKCAKNKPKNFIGEKNFK